MKFGKNHIRTNAEQIALSIFLGILSLGACAYVVLSYNRSVATHIRRIAESALIGTAGEVANWVREKKKTIELIDYSLAEFEGEPEAIKSYLKKTNAQDKDFIDIFYGTAAGPKEKGFAVYASDWLIPADYDWTTRRWYVEAFQKGGIVVTAPYQDLQTGKTIISISQPVTARGVLLGVIASDISTATVKDILYKVYTAKGSRISLIDAEGNYINSDDSKGFAGGNALSSPELRGVKEQILSGKFFMKMDAWQDRYYASIGLPELGWIMYTEGALSSFENVRGTIIEFSAILLFLAGLLLFMLIRTWRANLKLLLATQAIERANRDLELTVQERTASLQNILNNAEEGFLTFGEALVVDPSFSRGCLDLFGKEIAGLSVPDLLFPGMTQVIEDFRRGFELYFQGKSKAQIIIDLTEKQTTIRDHVIRIAYKETAGGRILCILSDVTLEVEVAEKNRRESETQQRILRAIHNKHSFAQYVEAADELFEYLEIYASKEPMAEERASLMRMIHTFKGDSGFFGFLETQGTAHESETLIGDSASLGTAISYKEALIQIRKAYCKELKTITDTMGDRWIDESGGVVMARGDFRKLIAYLRKKLPGDAKLHLFLDSFRKISLAELFSRLPFAAAMAAEKLGKKIKPMAIVGGNLKVVPDRYMALADACIHIVNNMVDHGIEYPYERESMQKPPAGAVQLSIAVDKSTLVLEFADDGRGVNPREIERIAKERGLVPEGRSLQSSELYALLFEDGFSTRSEATTTSGRGVGLAAVRQEVKRLGGSIEVKSRLGKGCAFELSIPLSGGQ